MSATTVDDKIRRGNDAKAISIVQRLERMMNGVRAPDDHPARWNSVQSILYIARSLHIQKDMSGPVLVDEATIAWLEEAYARRPGAQDIVVRLRRKALGRPYEHACLLIEAAEEIERLRDER